MKKRKPITDHRPPAQMILVEAPFTLMGERMEPPKAPIVKRYDDRQMKLFG